jgi:hypothetical protein
VEVKDEVLTPHRSAPWQELPVCSRSGIDDEDDDNNNMIIINLEILPTQRCILNLNKRKINSTLFLLKISAYQLMQNCIDKINTEQDDVT